MFTNLLISLPFIFCLRIPMTDPTTQKKSCFPASCRSSQHVSGILYHLLPGSSSTRLISAGKIVKAIVVLLTVIFNNKNSKVSFLPSPRLPGARCHSCLSSQAQFVLELSPPSWWPDLLHVTSSKPKQFLCLLIWGQLEQSPSQKTVTNIPVIKKIPVILFGILIGLFLL